VHLILVRIGSNGSLRALVNLFQEGVEDRATESLPTRARHLGNLINGRIDTIVRLILVLPGAPVEAKLAKDLLYLRLSFRVLPAVVSV